MATLKYFDLASGTWLPLSGAGKAFRQVAYTTSDFRTTQTQITATSWGVHTGPSIIVTLGPSGSGTVNFYCQVGATGSGGLLAAVGVKTYPGGAVVVAPDDNDCAFVGPPAAGHDGPGFLAATFHFTTYTPGQFAVAMNYHGGSGTVNIMRRRMTVIPTEIAPT